jgi:hypothetical protein
MMMALMARRTTIIKHTRKSEIKTEATALAAVESESLVVTAATTPGAAVGTDVGVYVWPTTVGAFVDGGRGLGALLGAYVWPTGVGALVCAKVGAFVGRLEIRVQTCEMHTFPLSHGVPSLTGMGAAGWPITKLILGMEQLPPASAVFWHARDPHAAVPSASPRNEHSPPESVAKPSFFVAQHCASCEKQLPP